MLAQNVNVQNAQLSIYFMFKTCQLNFTCTFFKCLSYDKTNYNYDSKHESFVVQTPCNKIKLCSVAHPKVPSTLVIWRQSLLRWDMVLFDKQRQSSMSWQPCVHAACLQATVWQTWGVTAQVAAGAKYACRRVIFLANNVGSCFTSVHQFYSS
jgi:hypothetical protein